jgi:hypothetical protein
MFLAAVSWARARWPRNARDGDRGQDADDQDDNKQLDEREALLIAAHSVYRRTFENA